MRFFFSSSSSSGILLSFSLASFSTMLSETEDRNKEKSSFTRESCLYDVSSLSLSRIEVDLVGNSRRNREKRKTHKPRFLLSFLSGE